MRLQRFLLGVSLSFATSTALAQPGGPPKTLAEALNAEFKCPEGSHDSSNGPMPGTIVRWCDVQKDGRPVYHGPVWRWYPSGKLEGKEYYLNGDAAGVWPSYYENGNMSSLGDWENGAKRGLWKYWNNGGKLLTEVAYSVDGNFQTDYYVSGQKKATGTFTPTGKTGKWIYWSRDGKEIARCDFGRGQFSLSTPGCRTIATELEPKGFSPPIPAGSKNPDGTLQLSVGTKLFKFSAPQGWIADMKAGHEEDLPIVFYPENKEWKAAGANMYIRAFFKKGRSFTRTIEEDQQAFEENVAEVHKQPDASGQLSGGFNYVSKSITYKPMIETDSPFSIEASNQIYEQSAYIDASERTVLLLVLTADSEQQLQQSMTAFQTLLKSVH